MRKRLSKYLSDCGSVSRREAEQIIEGGHVCVNGVKVLDNPFFLAGGEKVTVDGIEITSVKPEYFKYYKPKGFVCSKSDKFNKTIYDHLGKKYLKYTYIGRLDKDSEGLLLLTNDGQTAQRMSHPKYSVSREYLITTNRELTPSDRDRMRRGITDKGEFLMCDHIKKTGKNRYHLVLHTGKNREIRRMVSFLGKKVTSLIRVSYGGIKLGDIREGSVIPLNSREMRRIFGD